MKRVLTILAILLLPLSVWAMTPVTDSDLSNVTGQAGVNINADVTMDITIGTMSWGDKTGLDAVFGWDSAQEALLTLYSKGITGTGIPTGPAGAATLIGTYNIDGGGYVGVTNFNLTNLRIRARVESTDTYGNYSRGDHTVGANNLKPITIDVATDKTGEWYGAGITFVRIGLGSLQISMDDLTFKVGLGNNGALLNYGSTGGVANTAQTLGQVYVGGLNLYINSQSYVDIFNARSGGNMGVTMNMSVTIDKIALKAVSWGDLDGTTCGTNYNWFSGSAAGFVGINDINMGAISITGAVNIDVNTATAGEYVAAAKAYWTYASAYLPTQITLPAGLHPSYPTGATIPTAGLLAPSSVTVVHFTFGRNSTPFTIDVGGPITADVQLSDNKQLFGFANTKSLGDIYISGLKMDIKAGSWVDIWAH